MRIDTPILTPRDPGTAAAPPPSPSWLEAAGASWRVNQDDSEDAQVLYQLQGYGKLADRLMVRGYPAQRYGVSGPAGQSWLSKLPGVPGDGGTEISGRYQDHVWGDVVAERAKAKSLGQPDPFPDIPQKRSEFNTFAARRMGGRDRDQSTADRGGFGTSIVPGVGFGLLHATDPENLLQLPMGAGGRTIAGMLARQFVAGTVGTVLTTPERAGARGQMGEGYSGDDLAKDALLGGVSNAGLVGLQMGITKGGKLAHDSLPLDYRLAQQLKREVPVAMRSPQQQAAINVIERGAEIDATNPGPGTYEGLDAHSARLQDTMDMLEGLPRSATPQLAPDVPAAATPRPAPPPAPAAPRGPARGRVGFDNFVYEGLKRRGLPEHVARGVAAGIHAESASNPNVRGGYKGRAVGYGQWLGPRREELIRRYGPNPTPDQQLDFMVYELNGGDAGGRKVLAAGDEVGVLNSYIKDFMRPAAGAETSGDLNRGMAALGRGGEDMPGDVEAGGAAAAAPLPERPAAMDAAPVAVDLPGAIRPEVMRAGLPRALAPVLGDLGRSLNDIEGLSRELGVSQIDLRTALDDLTSEGRLIRTKGGLYRRPAVQSGPEDMVRFIARRGGLSPDGFSEAQRLRNLDADNPPKGHDLKNSGNLDHFVPGTGPLLRKTGMGLDEAGEKLWEAGYFGPIETTPRPTEAELITLLDRVIGRKEKRYGFSDQAPDAKAAPEQRYPGFDSLGHFEQVRGQWLQAAERVLGRDLSDDEFGRALGQARREPSPLERDVDGAGFDQVEHLDLYVERMVNREIDAALEDAWLEIEDARYDFGDDSAGTGPGQAGRAGQGGEGSSADPGNPDARGAGAGDGPGADQGRRQGLSPAALDAAEAEGRAGPVFVDQAASKSFDDPAAGGIEAAADSVWHDIRADQEITSKPAEPGGLAAKTASEEITPLFDLDDGRGPRSIAEIDAELKAGESGIDAIRGCL